MPNKSQKQLYEDLKEDFPFNPASSESNDPTGGQNVDDYGGSNPGENFKTLATEENEELNISIQVDKLNELLAKTSQEYEFEEKFNDQIESQQNNYR